MNVSSRRNVSDKFGRKSKHILCSITFSENHSVYEIIWKNMAEPDRLQMTVYCNTTLCMLDIKGYRPTL